jgi:hypothetical protein
VYKDMKAGFLADDTDHGTRELREIFKGKPFHRQVRRLTDPSSRGSSSRSSLSSSPRECSQSPKTPLDTKCL